MVRDRQGRRGRQGRQVRGQAGRQGRQVTGQAGRQVRTEPRSDIQEQSWRSTMEEVSNMIEHNGEWQGRAGHSRHVGGQAGRDGTPLH